MKSLLESIEIASPCPTSWESMEGDDKVRFCKICAKNVYNLSAMKQEEAESFLQENGASKCLSFYRRGEDGMVMTSDCPSPKERRNLPLTAKSVAAATALSLALSACSTTEDSECHQLLGRPAAIQKK